MDLNNENYYHFLTFALISRMIRFLNRGSAMRMAALRPGQRAVIRGFKRSAMARSYCKLLLSMGLLPNTKERIEDE